MELLKKKVLLELHGLLLLNVLILCMAREHVPSVNWETWSTRLCSTQKIFTANGLFPGPALYMHKGDRLKVNVRNQGKYNITIHWHGVKQPRNPWSDGPVYITQCPIKPGANFTYEIILSTEEGTLWWHTHSDWSRTTVHGPIIILPKIGTTYPFPKPHAVPIVLASWYKGDVMEMIKTSLRSGGDPMTADAFTINGQPGDLYNCSKEGTFRMTVDHGQTYLLCIINSISNDEMFFMIAHHNLIVVGIDGAYIKPIRTSYIMIIPGQTMDVLIKANHVVYANTTTTAILQYSGNYTAPSTLLFPDLPNFTDIDSATNFTERLRALASKDHPVDVPKSIDTQLLITISMDTFPCSDNNSSEGTNGMRLASSMNNISFVQPSVDTCYEPNFPSKPPFIFNFTATKTPDNVTTPGRGTKVRILEYNSTVEIVFQGTNVLNGAENHPVHLHGYSFYVVGSGFGNFNNRTDPNNYNLVDPPELNTVGVPKNGWAAIRFRADNPGVCFLHCHLEQHSTWAMDTVLIVKNGKTPSTSF
ncbi:hypothetical protein PVL29_024311 [Vitis rotundifolia]|uniref:Laccase n=1 Tax=Vitis rotundifolia TaxID=103349 RepID=A0AA39D817_VITRO|nr:hypothetical protein PVL29_024311 [Vitis rotundifolia]